MVLNPLSPSAGLDLQEEGIISYLGHKYGGNIIDQRIIDVSTSSIVTTTQRGQEVLMMHLYDHSDSMRCNPDYAADFDASFPEFTPRNLAFPKGELGFRSDDLPNQWVIWNFEKYRVIPMRYFIRSGLLKSWILEGSDDWRKWTQIDVRENCRDLEGGKSGMFEIEESKDWKWIRLTQTGMNLQNSNVLEFRGFEIYGNLIEP
jgi:hypothetical protein